MHDSKPDQRANSAQGLEPAAAAYAIGELVDLVQLGVILDQFSRATGVAAGLASYPEGQCLVSRELQDICARFHSAMSRSRELCHNSRRMLAAGMSALGQTRVVRCQLGLVDGGTPIVIKGRRVATLYAGQVLFEEPDMDLFARQAEKFGYDIEGYLAALSRVPVMTREQFDNVLAFLGSMATVIADMGLNALEAKDKDRQLREGEESYRALVEQLSDVVYAVDERGMATYVSPVVETVLGYAPSEIIGRNFADFLSEEDRERAVKGFERNLSGEGRTGEFGMLTKSGDKRWVRTSTRPVRHDGRVTGVRGVLTDITEHKKAEDAVRQSEEQLRALFESAGSAIGYFDTEGKILLVNNNVVAGLGVPKEFLIGRSLFDFVPREEAGHFWNIIERCIKENRGQIAEESVPFPDGTRWFLANFQPIRDTDGNVVGVQTIATDITKQKQAQEELNRLRTLLSDIVNLMPSPLVGMDRQGRVTQWNREAEKATGVTAAQATGRELSEVYPALAGYMDDVRHAVSAGQTQKREKVPISFSGETRLADITVYPLISGEMDGAVIRVDDVTERVRIEEMMIQSEKMLSLGGLAAGMAHEINNPLAGVMHSMMVLLNRLRPELEKNQSTAEQCGTSIQAVRDYFDQRGLLSMIESARTSGQRIADIVDNILSFSRKGEGAFTAHDLGVLLDKTVALASNEYRPDQEYDFRQIKIVREYNPKTPKAWCEAGKVQQVFLNLLKNGAQAMTPLDSPRAEPARLTLRAMPDNGWVRVEIEDSGPGMEEEVRRRVFEPFFTTKSAGRGTGLGLSLSYFIIAEHHGGTMAVESARGRGTKFVIGLPAEDKDHCFWEDRRIAGDC